MHNIKVSIVYAKPEQQWILELSVPRGTSAYELFELSQLRSQCEELMHLNKEQLVFGVYAEKVEHDHLLEEGDRVELYRPLTADPKEVRRQLALMGKTMGKKNT